jgi:hypothetical protein
MILRIHFFFSLANETDGPPNHGWNINGVKGYDGMQALKVGRERREIDRQHWLLRLVCITELAPPAMHYSPLYDSFLQQESTNMRTVSGKNEQTNDDGKGVRSLRRLSVAGG